tara:strand:- start:3721 stop:4803 length:1083 start_codon:yes stop_codon:yes gene_type:complete
MSDLRVTNLKGRTPGSSPTLSDGVVVSGISTFNNNVTVDGGNLTFTSQGDQLVFSNAASNPAGNNGCIEIQTSATTTARISGDSNQFKIHNDDNASQSFDLRAATYTILDNDADYYALFYQGACKLYHPNTAGGITDQKFETTADGIAVAGIVTATSGIVTYYGDGSNLTGIQSGVWTQIDSQQISSSTSQVDVIFGANAGITTAYAQIKVYYDVWLNSADKLYVRGAHGFSGTFANDVKTTNYYYSGFWHRAGEAAMNFPTQGENVPSGLISANNNKEHHNGEMIISNAAGRLYTTANVNWPALVYNTQGYTGGDTDAHNFTISGHLKGGDNSPLQGIRILTGGQNIIAGEVRTYGLTA